MRLKRYQSLTFAVIKFNVVVENKTRHDVTTRKYNFSGERINPLAGVMESHQYRIIVKDGRDLKPL
jgi:hypothetical protein